LLYASDSGNQRKKTEMGRACSMYVTKCGAYRVLVGKPEGWRPLGRPRSRCEYNIKIDLKGAVCRTWSGSIWLRIGTGSPLL
jgi:hypothetical protein